MSELIETTRHVVALMEAIQRVRDVEAKIAALRVQLGAAHWHRRAALDALAEQVRMQEAA
jgi:hypothetical protein